MTGYFKNRYNTDPEYRTKHKNYINSKIQCKDCGKLVSRSNLSHHKNLKYHKQLIQDKINKMNEQKVQEESDRLKSIIQELRTSNTTEQYESLLINV